MKSNLSETTIGKRTTSAIIFSLLLVLVLLAGAYFRFNGLSWGDNQYLHPDERFLVWVGTDISPVQSLSEYFNTTQSSLNPNNRGHGFYVYGTLPMFLARYVVQWVYGHSGFAEMTEVGRTLSALADLTMVLLVFVVGERLYDRRVGILAAAFSAATVLQIQQSHFFTMDTFVTTFTFMTFAFAVWVLKAENRKKPQVEPAGYPNGSMLDAQALETTTEQPQINLVTVLSDFFHDPLFLPSLGFGI